jgi:Rnl2 family RNA ligase
VGVFHKYPEIVTLDKRPEILAVKEVIGQEKLHGTSFRLFFPDGMSGIADVQFGGRNEVFGTDDNGKFYGGRPVRWFKSQPELLQRMADLFRERGYSDVIVYGEICGAGIQKGVRYVKGDEILFRAFDVRIGENLVTHDLFVEICDAVGLPRVPEVWRGEPSLEAFDALLEQPSLEGQRNEVGDERNLLEGVVIRSNPLLRNVFGEWLIIKHKSEKFAEVAKANIRQERADLTPVETFARTYVVRGRIVNALGRLRDVGTPLVNGMEDMKFLVPAMVEDLHKECEAEWPALLAQGFTDKQIRSAVSKTLAAVYQRMLLEGV